MSFSSLTNDELHEVELAIRIPTSLILFLLMEGCEVEEELLPASGTVSASFGAVEELEEANTDVGWEIEYRQLSSGSFGAQFTGSERDGISVTSERFNSHLHIIAKPPEGIFGLVLPKRISGEVRSWGRDVSDEDLIFFPAQAEMEFVTSGNVCDDAVYVSQSRFEDMGRALFPRVNMAGQGRAELIRGSVHNADKVRRLVTAINQGDRSSTEDYSELLTMLVAWIAESEGKADAIVGRSGTFVARRVREYFEENFRETIRMDEVCRYAGVGLRTVQRSFAECFQVSPTDYLKARRLNEARRDLVAADQENETVTQVALRCGYSHLGRFSVDYREHFGESPSVTLTR